MRRGLEIDAVGVVLNGQSSETEILASPLGASMKPLVFNGEHHSYSVSKPIRITDQEFQLNLYFYSGYLNSVSMSLSSHLSSWDDVTDAYIKNTKQLHDAWVMETFGKTEDVSMPWGRISSEIDIKNGMPSIVCVFNS